jgi:hypothetical protein
MFIEISPHEGVWVNSNMDSIYDWEHYRLNLNFVKAVYFEKREMFECDGKLFEFHDEYGSKIYLNISNEGRCEIL